MESIEYESRNITGSTQIAKHTLDLALIIPRANGSNGFITVYDGVDTAGTIRMRLKVLANTSFPFVFNPHVYFFTGLYIVFQNNIDDCFVLWRLRPKGES
ncbi:hypothetical protein LCGC14_0915690 [marine sediment metagenome]|uniref:Uncharacterized protein n=1 Tax=marine sediment metagenome TaxID=412755 RepID=A0A0F9PD30_9ZZZZ